MNEWITCNHDDREILKKERDRETEREIRSRELFFSQRL